MDRNRCDCRLRKWKGSDNTFLRSKIRQIFFCLHKPFHRYKSRVLCRAKLELSHTIFLTDSIMPSAKLAKIQTAFGNIFSLRLARNRT